VIFLFGLMLLMPLSRVRFKLKCEAVCVLAGHAFRSRV
jgi:hypothetical protein